MPEFCQKVTRDELAAAYDAWGCNCGPSALAAVLERSLDEIRPAVEAVGFAEKRYMSPSMMMSAVTRAGARVAMCNRVVAGDKINFPNRGLARIQWTGPWTAPGVTPMWAYRNTHWVAAGLYKNLPVIFDCNDGYAVKSYWERFTVPRILETCVPRNTGDWFITHSWEIEIA